MTTGVKVTQARSRSWRRGNDRDREVARRMDTRRWAGGHIFGFVASLQNKKETSNKLRQTERNTASGAGPTFLCG